MHAVSDRDLLHIWELGQKRHSVERALLLLAPLHPGLGREALAALTIGQRNHELLDLREQITGRELRGFADCPGCGARNGFTVLTEDIRRDRFIGENHPRHETLGAYQITYRLPDSRDLIALLPHKDPDTGYSELIARLITEARWQDRPIEIAQLPAEVIAALGERMTDLDPQTEVRFSMSCFSCNEPWSPIFDIMSFLWSEINVIARQLLTDVMTLARYYGWSEQEILAMSEVRRNTYLELAEQHE